MLNNFKLKMKHREYFSRDPYLLVSYPSVSESIRAMGTTDSNMCSKLTFLRFSGFSLEPRIADLGLRDSQNVLQ